MRSWLILADDLTGAADCAVAFSARGHAAEVCWKTRDSADIAILAVDADSRGLEAGAAAARHGSLTRAMAPGRAVLKKIDSTLRGQPAAELAENLRVMRNSRGSVLALVAPAFPATGRTTEAARIRLNGAPLEASPLWQREHSYPNADLRSVLAGAGLSAAHLPLAGLRGGQAEAALRATLAGGQDALICDAVTQDDLEAIVAAGLPLAESLLWVGSGGLAEALAKAQPPGGLVPPLPGRREGGLLLVVGSLAEISREAASAVLAEAGLRHHAIPPDRLLAGDDALSAEIAAVIAGGADVLVTIAAEAPADLRQGPLLAAALARLLAPAGRAMGGLFATGGETARALLDRLGVQGLRLLAEIEPGMPLAISRGAIEIPVVTKAGGFGHAGSIMAAHGRLTAMRDRREGTP